MQIEELKNHVNIGQRVLGIDLGTKTIGLALSDTKLTVASPMQTIKRTKFSSDVKQLIAIFNEHDIAAVIIGLPINMNGSEGPRAQATRAFASNLQKSFDIPVLFWDERLSTSAVTRTIIDADLSRKRNKEVVDKMAAAYILQGALERLRLA